RGGGGGLRHEQVSGGGGGGGVAARDAAARAQDIIEAGLDPMLLEVGLHDARRRVDRSTGCLIDDPADVAGGELLLRPGRATQLRDAACRGRAERGAPRVAQETAPVDPQLASHVVLLLPFPPP